MARTARLAACLALLLATSAWAQTVSVSAASSLTEAAEELAAAFEARHDGVEVEVNLGSSSTLATQIVQGAPVDVFMSANLAQMQVVVDEGLVRGEPAVFARNRLVVIAPQASPVASLEDLAEEGVLLVLAGPEVPVGAYARRSIEKMDAAFGGDFGARVLANVVSEEINVRAVAAKVRLGEADAAIVYATDAVAVPDARVIEIPDELNVVGDYPVAVLAGARDPELARAFVELVLASEGQDILAGWGFAAVR
jgi:molybdate transport system substrate-binding protein